MVGVLAAVLVPKIFRPHRKAREAALEGASCQL